MLKLSAKAFVAILPDEATRQNVLNCFEGIPAVSTDGGMTLDCGKGPIVVCMYKPSLADEKAIRAAIREFVPKAKLSRTNDIRQRCDDYRIAMNPKEWKRMFGAKSEPTTEPTDTPAINVLADPPIEPPTTETGDNAAGV